MQQFTDRLEAAKKALQNAEAKYKTWGSFTDDVERHTELEKLIDEYVRGYCKGCYFESEHPVNEGNRLLIYSVNTEIYTGSNDENEDGTFWDSIPITEPFTIWVSDSFSLLKIAKDLAVKVKAIEGNAFVTNSTIPDNESDY